MVRILNRKLLRELRSLQGLLLLIAGIVGVGVTCFVAMQSAYRNLDRAKELYYRRCRMADYWIDLKKAPVSELAALKKIDGVRELQSRIQFPVTVDLESVQEPVNGIAISLPDQQRDVINGIVLRQGGYFTPQRSDEVLVNEKFARANHLYPGQTLHLLINNRRLRLHIVGTAISSEFTYLVGNGSIVPDPEHFGVFYLKRTYAEEVFDFEGACNQVVGTISPEAAARTDDILRRAETLLEPYGVFATTPRELQVSNQFLSSEIEGLGSFATVVPAIFLAVAALVLNVLVNRMARRQRIVVGTLKALGYEDRDIFWHFLMFSTAVGIVGAALGSGLGHLASAGMTLIYRGFFEFPELPIVFYWQTNLLGAAVSVLCAAAGGLHGARMVLKLRPAEAMRPEPPRRGGAILLERLMGAMWRRLDADWRMVLRTIFRNRGRTATSIFAATMGAGLLVCGLMMAEAQQHLVEFQFERELRSDFDLVFKDQHGRDALVEVTQLPGVDLAEPILNVACTFVNGPYRRKGGVTGLVAEPRLTVPRDRAGQPLRIPSSGLIVTRRLAEILHLESGQKVTVVPVKGARRPVEVPIALVADSYMGLAAYADIDFLSAVVDEEFVLTGAQVVTDPNTAKRAAFYRELKRLPGVEAVRSRQQMVKKLTETLLEHQHVFIGVIVFFSGTIFFGSIVNASMVSLAERRAEVATFRALGYSEFRVGALFFRENLITNTCGTLAGLPVGYLLMWLTAWSYNNDTLRLPVVTAAWIWWSTLLASALFAVLAHAVVQWQISKMQVLAALKVQE